MTLDIASLRNDFARDGFAIAPNLFTRSEVQGLKLECIDILEAVKAETGTVAGHGVYVGLAARSPVFQTAVGDVRLLDILEGILAPDIEFLSDKVVFKSESMTFASPWHQDWHYWHGAHKLSIWVALDDATVENGCLKLFPVLTNPLLSMMVEPMMGTGSATASVRVLLTKTSLLPRR